MNHYICCASAGKAWRAEVGTEPFAMCLWTWSWLMSKLLRYAYFSQYEPMLQKCIKWVSDYVNEKCESDCVGGDLVSMMVHAVFGKNNIHLRRRRFHRSITTFLFFVILLYIDLKLSFQELTLEERFIGNKKISSTVFLPITQILPGFS